jgi:hypothetical protein
LLARGLGFVPSLRDSSLERILAGTTVPGYSLFRPRSTSSPGLAPSHISQNLSSLRILFDE